MGTNENGAGKERVSEVEERESRRRTKNLISSNISMESDAIVTLMSSSA